VGQHLPLKFLISEPIADPNLHRQQRECRLLGRLQRKRRLAGLIRSSGLGWPPVRLPGLSAHSMTILRRAALTAGTGTLTARASALALAVQKTPHGGICHRTYSAPPNVFLGRRPTGQHENAMIMLSFGSFFVPFARMVEVSSLETVS
jgi:hypothetical protein